MSFETSAPRLPPFGIRELYGRKTGILHISKPQYDSTIRSYPDAVLSYVDDDDGEVITVGSGLELEQRLDEPIRSTRRRNTCNVGSESPRSSLSEQLVHLFDIQRTQDNLAIWNEHEPYSSKSLRSSRSSSISEDGHQLLAQGRPDISSDIFPDIPAYEPETALNAEGPTAETHDESQKTAEIISEASEATARPVPSNDFIRDLNDVLTAACQGLESFGLADILDNTAQALQSVARKTRESDTSPVEGLLGGIKDIVSEFGRFGLEVLQNLDNPPVHTVGSTDSASSSIDPPTSKAAAKKIRRDEKKVLKEAVKAQKELRKEEKRARREERLAHKEENESGKNSKTAESSDRQRQQDLDITSRTGTNHALPESFPEVRKRVSFADLQHNELKEQQNQSHHVEASLGSLQRCMNSAETAHLEHIQYPGLKPALSVPREPEPAPGNKLEARSALFETLRPVGQYRSFPNRPGPVRPTAMQNGPSQTGSTSIMDLETSNPDFTRRYPPLMSLRRAKTVSELQKKSEQTAAANKAMTTKAALSRYPSIGQLEARRRDASDDTKNSQVALMQAEMIRRRERQKAEAAARSSYRSPSVEDELDIITRSKPDISPLESTDLASNFGQSLPGAWPEPRQERSTVLASAKESSGAFFNRMAGIKDPESPQPRAVSPALSCRTTSPPEDPYFFPSKGLRRAHTVTASNPAARLTRPFDPLVNAPRLGASIQQTVMMSPQPQRSFTIQHPRRLVVRSTEGQATSASALSSNFARPAQVPLVQPPQPPAVPQIRPPHFPRPIWPDNNVTSASISPPNLFPSPMRSGPNLTYPAPTPTHSGRNGLVPAPPSMSKVEECVKTLRAMGYGMSDPNEAARLNVYAGAAAGDVREAIDMIEEDRQAAEAIKHGAVNIRVL